MDLDVVRTLDSLFKNNNINDMNSICFSYHIMQLKCLANHLKDHIILIQFENFMIFWRKLLVKWFETAQE